MNILIKYFISGFILFLLWMILIYVEASSDIKLLPPKLEWIYYFLVLSVFLFVAMMRPVLTLKELFIFRIVIPLLACVLWFAVSFPMAILWHIKVGGKM